MIDLVGCEYGNTRLRARRARLLDRVGYGQLARSTSVESLIGALGEGDYRVEVDRTVVRARGLSALDAIARTRLATRLREMVAFYGGHLRARVALLGERWDVRNLHALIRAAATPGEQLRLVEVLTPAGRLDETDLAELARARTVRELAERMLAWRLPTAQVARRVFGSLEDYLRSRDPRVVEAALDHAWAGELAHRLGPERDPLSEFLQAEIDRTNLTNVLRSVQATERNEQPPGPEALLEGGAIPLGLLADVLQRRNRAEVREVLRPVLRVPGWERAVRAWEQGTGIEDVSTELDTTLTSWAVSWFGRGDPLSTSIPVAYTAAAENEARNLRILARSVGTGLAPEEILTRLVIP